MRCSSVGGGQENADRFFAGGSPLSFRCALTGSVRLENFRFPTSHPLVIIFCSRYRYKYVELFAEVAKAKTLRCRRETYDSNPRVSAERLGNAFIFCFRQLAKVIDVSLTLSKGAAPWRLSMEKY